MRKFVLVFCFINLFCFNCFALTDARIKELQDEGKKLIETRQQYTQAVQQIDMRLLEIQGALKEDAQEKEAKKK